MTSPECPVCATPYEAGAETCAFCGVSLLEPPAEVESKSEAEPAAQPVAQSDTRVDESPSPASVDTNEPAADTVLTDEAPTDEALADDPSQASAEVDAAPADKLTSETTETIEDADTPEIPEIPAPSAPQAPGLRAPSFTRKPTAASAAQQRARRIEWGVVAGLAALLLVQVVASDFDQLAGNAATRPWLQHTCSFLRCTLPPWREPQALRLLQRDVRANPERPGLLRISASFRNDARWAQPWPRLRVILSDADGRAIAARDFGANEYLGTRPTANGIASGQVAGVAVDVVDPSPRVTAFTFEFR